MPNIVNKILNEIRTFMGGMNKDSTYSTVPKNQYIEAESIKLTEPTEESLGAIRVAVGNTDVASLGAINFATDDDDYKAWRVAFDLTANGINHTFNFYNAAGTLIHTFTISGGGGSASSRYNALKAAFNTQVGIWGTGGVYIDATIAFAVVHAGVRVYGNGDYILKEVIAGINVATYIIKEYFGTACNGTFGELKTYDYLGDLFHLTTNNHVLRLSVATKDTATGNWTNVIVFQTKTIVISKTKINIVDVDMELDFNQKLALYFTAEGVLPRVIYTHVQAPYAAMSDFKYNEDPLFIETGNDLGYFYFDTVEEATRLQVLENFAQVTFASMQEGGSLKAGDKMYAVRQNIGDTVASGFSLFSNPIPVMSRALTDNDICGDNGGTATSKSITLVISGLNPSLYTKFDLAVVENTNGVITAKIVDTYNITSTTQAVTHTGFEASSLLTVTELVTQQILILDAANLVINRNKLFLSNVTVQNDYNLSTWAKTISIATLTNTTNVAAIGNGFSAVGEYELPQNVTNYLGYIDGETYRFGIMLYFKNGFVTSPYFIADYKIAPADHSLTTVDGNGVPVNIRVFRPRFTIDMTQPIDGVPLRQLLYAYSIVRQPCIPEILGTGIAMPTSFTETGGGHDYFTVGGHARELIPYTYGGATTERTQLGFLCTDSLFGQTTIMPLSSHELIIYGNGGYYNGAYERSGGGGDQSVSRLLEFNGAVGASTLPVSIQVGENVKFNTNGIVNLGTISANNRRYQTVVVESANQGANNQASLGIELQAANYAINLSANTDYAFYQAAYYAPASGKYGDENRGSYIGCGHMRIVEEGVTSDVVNIYGGDAFVQKNVIKFCNRDAVDGAGYIMQNTAGGTWPAGTYDFYVYSIMPNGDQLGYVVTTFGVIINDSITITSLLIPNTATYKIVAYNGVTAKELYSSATRPVVQTFAAWAGMVTTSYVVQNVTTTRTAVTYYSQNRINTQMRYFTGTETVLNYPYQTLSLNEWLNTDELDEGTLKYSASYTPLNNFQTFAAFNKDTFISNTSMIASAVYFSLPKLINSPQDSYRKILPLNVKFFPQIYGACTNMFIDENYLVLMFEGAVIMQPIDMQALGTAQSQQTFILGDSSVLGAQEQILTNYGSPLKTGATSYLSSTGKYYTVWYNPFYKKLFRRGVDGIRDLGEQNLMQGFLYHHNDLVTGNANIAIGYDLYSSEVLVSTNATIAAATLYDNTSAYNQGDIVLIHPNEGMNTYYIAQINVDASDPDLPDTPEGLLQKWSIYRQSNYTLAFNEKTNSFSTFYPYSTRMFIPYTNTFLTAFTVPNSIPAAESFLYEHNRGNILQWYTAPPGFRNAYITTVLNNIPEVFKTLIRVWLKCKNIPSYLHVHSVNGTKTYAKTTDFQQKREFWWVNSKNDATITVTNPTGLNTMFTQRTGAETMTVTVFFNTENKMSELSGQMFEKQRLFNQ